MLRNALRELLGFLERIGLEAQIHELTTDRIDPTFLGRFTFEVTLASRAMPYNDGSMRMTSSCKIALTLGLALFLLSTLPAESTICVDPNVRVRVLNGLVILEGQTVPGVAVTAHRLDGRMAHGKDLKVITDEEGAFAFGRLPQGDYTLEASLEGFFTAVHRIRVRDEAPTNQVVVVEMVMLLGECSGAEAVSLQEARKLQDRSKQERSDH